MGSPYVGEIRLFSGDFAPVGWLMCDGQQVDISEFESLFNLIGTTYGGDGQTTFAIPDLRGRTPMGLGTSGGLTYLLGEIGGVEWVTLTTPQIPIHGVTTFSESGTRRRPSVALASGGAYGDPDGSSGHVSGGSQPHSNMAPYLPLSYIIATFGIYPSAT